MDKRYLKATAFVLGVFTGASAMAGISASSAYGQTNVAPPGLHDCKKAFVNDAGTVAGTCKDASNNYQSFVKLPSATSSTLLAASKGCVVKALSNAAAGNELILGHCKHNGADGGVVWQSVNTAAKPTKLVPLATFNGNRGRKTVVHAVNVAGVIVGETLAKERISQPTFWSSNGQPTALTATKLPKIQYRCKATGINDAAPPSIIGSCIPIDESQSSNALDLGLLWQGGNTDAILLTTGCTPTSINLAGQMFGRCVHIGGGFDTTPIEWGPGGTAPVPMSSVQTNAVRQATMQALESAATNDDDPVLDSGVINDSGVIVFNAMESGHKESIRWDTSNGNTVGVQISAPSGATGDVAATSIGNNGKIVGSYSAGGVSLPYTVESGSTVATGGSSPAGGPNATVSSLSPSGVNEVIVSEDPTLHKQPEVQTTP